MHQFIVLVYTISFSFVRFFIMIIMILYFCFFLFPHFCKHIYEYAVAYDSMQFKIPKKNMKLFDFDSSGENEVLFFILSIVFMNTWFITYYYDYYYYYFLCCMQRNKCAITWFFPKKKFEFPCFFSVFSLSLSFCWSIP